MLLFVVLEERHPNARPLGWLAFGACVGAALLIRGTAGLFLAVPFAIWWISRSFGGAVRNSAVAALGLALVVAPWTLRNLHAMGAPILVSTQQVGMALTFAHSEAADGGYSQRLIAFRDELVAPFADLANPEREVAEWRFEVERALAYARRNPLRELSLMPRRFFHLFAHDHAALPWLSPPPRPGDPKAPAFSARVDRTVAWVADLAFYALLIAAAFGARRAWTLQRPAALILRRPPGS
jgi:4-amino-4-deoxy-L-arabinose transferase-like glycosyltransferase